MIGPKFKKTSADMIKRAKSPCVALRLKAIEHLGARCNKCGAVDARVLQIDHVEGGGVRRRREGITSISECRQILNGPEGWNDEFQVLCANCNWIKRHELAEYNRGRKVHNPKPEDVQKWKSDATRNRYEEVYDPELHGDFCPDDWDMSEYDEHGNPIE